MFRRRMVVSREAKVFLLFIILIFLIIQTFRTLERGLAPVILALAAAQIHQHATSAINESIANNISVNYTDLISMVTDQNGNIVLAQVNNGQINSIIAQIVLQIKDTLSHLAQKKIHIPLGQALGSYLLAHTGPKIPVTITPLGIVRTDLVDKFEDAGFNQVRHKIYLKIETEMQIAIPFSADKVTVDVTIPLVDAIYPGEVPETIINLQLSNPSPLE
ncbi:MAG: sporulation protein YunB [Firmicutes bacterium]|mgnify:CR=1 FL=1|nr:sporulation protein YunB [Bacillota bacterium]